MRRGGGYVPVCRLYMVPSYAGRSGSGALTTGDRVYIVEGLLKEMKFLNWSTIGLGRDFVIPVLST